MRTMNEFGENFIMYHLIASCDSIVQLSPELILKGNQNIQNLDLQLREINQKMHLLGANKEYINSVDLYNSISANSILLPQNYMDNADYEKRMEELKAGVAKHEKMLKQALNESTDDTPMYNHRISNLENRIASERLNIFRYKRELQFHLTSRVPVDAAQFRARVDELMNQKLRLLELLHEYRRRGFLVNMGS